MSLFEQVQASQGVAPGAAFFRVPTVGGQTQAVLQHRMAAIAGS